MLKGVVEHCGVVLHIVIRSDLRATATKAAKVTAQYILAGKLKYEHVQSLSRINKCTCVQSIMKRGCREKRQFTDTV